jgi:hypothetical protein
MLIVKSTRLDRDRRSQRSDARDVDGVPGTKFAHDVIVAADEMELVRVGVLCSEALLPGEDPAPKRDAAQGDRASVPDRRKLPILTSIALPNAGVAPQEIFRERARPERVDAAFVVVDRGRVPMERAAGLESPLWRPAHVVPGEGFEAVFITVKSDMPETPRENGLARERAHAGTGSWTGSSIGAGSGTGSSSGVISISRSVSGRPMSIDETVERAAARQVGCAQQILLRKRHPPRLDPNPAKMHRRG